MKLKCIGGVHDGEYVYVDSYYKRGDWVKVTKHSKLNTPELFNPNKILETMTIKYDIYRIEILKFDKDDEIMFLIPQHWTVKEAILFQLNK